MAVMTIRMPDDRHERLKALAKQRGVSVNKLMEEFSIQAIAEADAFTRFQARAARGDVAAALDVLDKVDAQFDRAGN